MFWSGCGSDDPVATDSGVAVDAGTDSGSAMDAATDSGSAVDAATDSGSAVDAATDSGSAVDARTDSGVAVDARTDSGSAMDAATDSDSAVDAGTDSGPAADAATDGGDADACATADGGCVTLPSTCAAPTIVPGDGYRYELVDITLAGANINLDTGAGCVGVGGDGTLNSDLVFEVDLLAGESLTVTESGALDVVMHVIGSTCEDAAACLASRDSGDTVTYTAGAAQTVHVVVDSWGASPSSVDVDLLFTITGP